jgi:cytochrome P450
MGSTTIRIRCSTTLSDPRHNVAYARGVRSCPGGPLARIEGRVTIERILDRLPGIRINEAHHGPADARHFDYAPLYIIRGLQKLHVEFTAAS